MIIDKKSSYSFSADSIRVLAILGVVAIHTANAVYGRPDFFGGISWWVAIIINSFSRVSVPLFILLSGYLLLNKDESFKKSLKRTLHRLVIPFLFWFLADSFWDGGHPAIKNMNPTIFTRIFSVNVFDLYFFVILIGLYCVAPTVSGYLQKRSLSGQRNVMIISLIIGVLYFALQYIFYLCLPTNVFTYWMPYTGLFIAGYVLGNNAKNSKRTKTLLGIYSITLIATIVSSYFYFSLHNNGINTLDAHGCLSYYSDSYLSVNVVIMSLCIFSLLMHMQLKSIHPFVRKLVYSIARVSLGIFILHTFFLDILDGKLHAFDHIAPAWLYIFVKWFLIFLLSYISAIVFVRIPLVKRVFGETK